MLTSNLKNSYGLTFDGVNDYVNCSATGLPSGSTGLTVSVLINVVSNPINAQVFFSIGDGTKTARRNIGFTYNTDNAFSLITFGATIYAPTAFPSGLYHVVYTRVSGDNTFLGKIYVNNVQQSTVNFGTDGAFNLNPTLFYIGNYTEDFIYPVQTNTNIKHVKVFNRDLSAEEVSILYGGGEVSSGLVRDYRFTETTGFTLVDSVGGNNGTLTNFSAGDVALGAGNKWRVNQANQFNNTISKGVVLR